MGVLNTFQKISRVLPNQPFGDGVNSAATISSDPNTRATITGTATQTTGTAGSTAFANGDLVLLHQTQGTGAGQWEINRVASGGGTTSLTFQVAHNYTYGTGAQIIKIPRYTTATISNHSVTAWNGTTGGVEVIVSINFISSNTINLNGAIGVFSGRASGGGFRGGTAITTRNTAGKRGEGYSGAGDDTSTSANGNGGGGGSGYGGAGGGGHAASGDTEAGNGGGTVGIADLTSIFFGGSGGGGATNDDPAGDWVGGSGGNGGAILIIFAQNITAGTITLNGGDGQGWNRGDGGGGGAGGSCLIICNTATLGTGITAMGGVGLPNNTTYDGGHGSVGRIAVHHSGTVTGTTSPAFTDVSDNTLRPIQPGALFAALI